VTRLGLRANAAQFALLVALNALVGALVGLERSVLPLVGERDFGVASRSALLAFVAAFGVAKALANLVAGSAADRVGRKRLLLAGWLLAAPVPLLVGLATDWWHVVAANVFLGAGQGLAWSMTVTMKIDLAGPRRRGLALGLNEAAGYLGVAATAFATGALAATVAPRTLVWGGALAIAAVGAVGTALFVRDTGGHVALEEETATSPTAPAGAFRASAQAGFVNNLNDALVWGLVPLYLAARGSTVGEIGVVAAVYPAVWGLGQVLVGWVSDRTGRKPLIVLGMLVQAGALATFLSSAPVVAATLLGAGTALVYPTLLAAVSDGARPRDRARAVGRYRFWRDSGFVAGAVVAGLAADALGASAAIVLVAALTAASGIWVALTSFGLEPRSRPRPGAAARARSASASGGAPRT
jgi:MFS family permease